MKDVWIVAHAQSQHHVDQVVGGWFDTGLTDLGRRQAGAAADRLRDLLDGARPTIIASDLKRAAETAAVIGRQLGSPVTLDTDLREMNFGSAGGRPQAWMRENESYAPPTGNRMDHRSIADGESRRDVAIRAYRAMDRVVAMNVSPIVLVVHGGILTFLVAAWIGMPLDAAGYIGVASDTAGLTHLNEDDRRHNRWIQRLNDTTHLEGLT